MSDFTPKEIAILKSFAATMVNSALGRTGAASGSTEALDDHQLDKDWADKIVKKDPKRWDGPTQVGNRYSLCPPEWHDAQASLLAWKAQKEREETPPKLRDNGKPWSESTEFEAKLSRAWAKRLRASPTKTTAAPIADDPYADRGDIWGDGRM